MDAALHTPLCDAYAAHFGDSLDSRAFGAVMERRARSPGATVTEMEVLAALEPIEVAARKFRQALRKNEAMQEGSVLHVIFPIGRAAELDTFRKMLDELCVARERLESHGWKAKTTRGPIPRGGVDEWITMCFIGAWNLCIGHNVSTAERSRFMSAACKLLPLSGVDLGKDPHGRIARVVKRDERSRVAPLRGVR